ncbi:MAG TPA: YebC/PmpR family DNA-binding transcriptional regulator [Candidatus Gracilibacteria bacterium]|nr:YebC/PmpR family DNA-binding transcriptional regulator [Candidatus Gracilibacteria bacterium]
MSGHNKWSTIKHKKGAADALRGKLFTKHAKLIAIAARNGENPDTNALLKAAIANAKMDNVPSDNIKRAIAKGAGADKNAASYQELNYEGYAPSGIAIIIETLTDNPNRTYTNVRNIMNKNGGTLGEMGSVAWMFKLKGSMEVVHSTSLNLEQLEMDLIEAGAEDFEHGSESTQIFTAFADLGQVRDYLLSKNYQLENITKKQIPDNYQMISDMDTANKIWNLIEKLEEDEDVSEIYHNAEFSDDLLKSLDE